MNINKRYKEFINKYINNFDNIENLDFHLILQNSEINYIDKING
jgi:phage anti-repressor protein